MLALQASHLSSILSSSTPCFLKILYYNSTYLLFESLEVKETLHIEIGRRAYKKYEKDWFWKQFSFDAIDELWKQTLSGAKEWKELIIKIQKSKLKYRFLLMDYIQNAVFRKFNRKSKIEHILFYI